MLTFSLFLFVLFPHLRIQSRDNTHRKNIETVLLRNQTYIRPTIAANASVAFHKNPSFSTTRNRVIFETIPYISFTDSHMCTFRQVLRRVSSLLSIKCA